MLDRVSLRGVLAATCLALVPLFAVGWMTRKDPESIPYLDIQGGGFIFNYRVADVYYGFTGVVMRPIATGSIIEAVFEDPAGGPAHIVRERIGGPEMTRFTLRSPPVRGVVANHPYNVSIRVFDREETRLIWSRDMQFHSQISDDVVPSEPLTIGPGYARNPGAGG